MKDQLKTAMKEAMKAKDKLAVETIRSLLSALQYEEMNKKVDDLSDDQTIAVLKSELKKQKESLEYAVQDSREDLIAEAKARVACVEAFLPAQLSEEELEKILLKAKEEGEGENMGALMKYLGASYAGQYDGKTASAVAKRILG
ncbi:MAG: GatB/YqeY domain-containing protein [Bdellovibrionales bacterium]|nr:GatB/YqeY domain-containing protein [Bdellovibrionales bacterium]